jgi:hypothetical protein
MGDDWRLRVELQEESHAGELTELIGSELEHDLEQTYHDRVIVSRDGAEVFLYADTRDQVTKAEKLIHSLATEHGWHVESGELQRWHPLAERWEDPDKPLPSSEAEREAEHSELVSAEDEESRTEGWPEWEVRVQCTSHHDAKRLSRQLNSEGTPNLRRWTYLLIGAGDEDSARQLADRIQQEAPSGSKVTVEVSGRTVMEIASDAGRINPFVVF